ncbi:serine protease [Microcoleus sp. Pol12B4]|uniref:serine protease n=1 Tax=Microcoleus sp. Pol12B4 TaxID=3055395 RepID=UPI002FD3B94E
MQILNSNSPQTFIIKPISDIVEQVKSGVVHIIHTVDGQRAASGTGFMVNGYLVTNYHVAYQAPRDSVVLLRTYDSDSQILLDGIQLTSQEFLNRAVTASDERGYDYIVFDIPVLRNKKLYNFSLGNHQLKRMGDSILFLGYPLDHFNIVCHTGIISSFYKSRNVDIVQIDASVNVSNSGGPLIDPETSEVIGIITRKSTGLTQTFNELRSIIEQNIKVLAQQNSQGLISIGGFDPVQGIIANQHQILNLTYEIERSANVGIGYAFSIEQLKNENVFYTEEQP